MPSPLKISSLSLSDAIRQHILKEKASFHTPGHKGFAWQPDGLFAKDPALQSDLTELPGLDELAYPAGVLKTLEKNAAQLWGAQSTLVSVNGATAGILASILMLSRRGTHLLIPRNCHRAVIHGLVLSGLEPIWFDPIWQSEWGVWGPPENSEISNLLERAASNDPLDQKIAGILITSPTYAGSLADIKPLSDICDSYNVPLVVDEAHGAHLNWTKNRDKSALKSGASIIIHSLHKTLSCPTQTGLVHISQKGKDTYNISQLELRSCMNLIQSSSPSYLFMHAIDELTQALANEKALSEIKRVEELGNHLKTFISNTATCDLYSAPNLTVATHILIKHHDIDSQTLRELLIKKGIFAEAMQGEGLLFLLGIGSQEKDVEKLKAALQAISVEHSAQKKTSAKSALASISPKPKTIEQILSPKTAFFMPSHTVSLREAVGEISSECLAPCPPGWPILVPGQRITDELLGFKEIKSVRITKRNGQFNNV